MKLSKYHKRKLLKLDEFSGSLHEVFRFLDAVSLYDGPAFEDIGYSKQLPALPEKPQVAKDVLAHVKKITELMGSFKPSRIYLKDRDPEQYEKERQQWLEKKCLIEKAGLVELHEKYPHYGFDKILKERRFNNGKETVE